MVGVPAGYGLAIGKFPGRKLVLSLTLVVMIVPAAALVLPIFLELNAMHLIGNVLSVILPFSFFPFGVYLAYLYYATALPPGLLDAARVDGCERAADIPAHRAPAREAGRRARLLLQLRRPTGTTSSCRTSSSPTPNQYPITVGLWDLLASTPSFNPAVGGGGQSVKIFKPELALATLIAVVPVAIVFLFSQRALVRGLVGGAVKE